MSNPYQEGSINFLPTYKYARGSVDFNFKRTPSYTDRVLWKSRDEHALRPIFYRSHPKITCSDHKPVSALLEVEIGKKRLIDD